MSLSKVSVENSLKPEKFVKISWVDKLLPNYFSILKYLSITDFSVVKVYSVIRSLEVLNKEAIVDPGVHITLVDGVPGCACHPDSDRFNCP